jgi:hypothetical protein
MFLLDKRAFPGKGSPMTIDARSRASARPISTLEAVENAGTASATTIWRQAFQLAFFVGLLAVVIGSIFAIRGDRGLLDRGLGNVPLDVVAFGRRSVECQDWLNFAIIDEATNRRVQDSVTRLACNALAVDLDKMRRKYGHSPLALQALEIVHDNGL